MIQEFRYIIRILRKEWRFVLTLVFAGFCLFGLASPAFSQGDPDPMGHPRKAAPPASQRSSSGDAFGLAAGVVVLSLVRRSRR